MRTLITAALAALLLGTGTGCFFDLGGDDRYREDRSAYDRGPAAAFVARMGDQPADLDVTGSSADDVDVRAVLGSDDAADLHRSDVSLYHHGDTVELLLHAWDDDVHLDRADVTLSRAARLDLATGSGDIHVSGMEAPIAADTGSGDVDVQTLGTVDLSTGSGDVVASGGAGSVFTGSGDVRYAVDTDASGTLRIRTGSGDVHLVLPRGLGVDIDAQTGSGDVSVAVGGVVLSRDGSVRLSVNGGGTLQLLVETGSGDVDLRD
jgi:hypothetical protein